MEWISNFSEWILMGIVLLMTVLLICFVSMTLKYSKLKKSYTAMLNRTNVPDLEKIVIDIHKDIIQLQTDHKQQSQYIENMQSTMKLMKTNVGIHRYNAFDQQGNDLSFSVAFIDEYKSGIVISGIHSREQTYIYAKALEKGDSKHVLSPEEKQAINLALHTT